MAILNTNLKVFAHPDKLRSLPGTTAEVLPPLHVRIKPTNICNHDCWFCAYRQDDFQLGQAMVERDQIPLDKMMEIIDDLIEMQVQAVTFSGGGEPFVYPHLLKAVERLAAAGIPFASLTNGSRLSGELARVFAQSATWVRVSMDGWDGPQLRQGPARQGDRVRQDPGQHGSLQAPGRRLLPERGDRGGP